MLSFLTSAGFIPDFPIVGSPQWVHTKQSAWKPRSSLVGAVGLEPTSLAAADFKSAAYANSATLPRCLSCYLHGFP